MMNGPTVHDRLHRLVGDPPRWLEELTVGCDLLVVDTGVAGDDPVTDWLLTGTDRLFAVLRRLLAIEERDPIVALFLEPTERGLDDPHRPMAEATFAAVQASMHSLALEHPRTRACVVRAYDTQAVAVTDVLDLVSSSAGAYVCAATIDLRSAG